MATDTDTCYLTRTIDCCGIVELAQLNKAKSPEDALIGILRSNPPPEALSKLLGIKTIPGWWRETFVYINPTKKGGEYEKRHSGWDLRPACAFVVFSDHNAMYELDEERDIIEKRLYGKPFADFLTKNKLGTVVHVGHQKNPNSGNNVDMWVWTPNEKAVMAWAKKNYKPEPTLPLFNEKTEAINSYGGYV